MKFAVVIGDIHGEFNTLQSLMKIIRDRFKDEVDIYSTGDLIDRGPSSKDVIQLCIDEGINAQIGNHEQYLQTFITTKIFEAYCLEPIMGGAVTIESYGVDIYSEVVKSNKDIATELLEKIPNEHKDWIAALPRYRKIEVDKNIYWLTHTGVRDSVYQKWKRKSNGGRFSDEEALARIASYNHGNEILWPSPSFGAFGNSDNLAIFEKGIQIFGHKPVKRPIIKNHFIALDTGCGTCSPWALSAVILPTHEIIQVSGGDWC